MLFCIQLNSVYFLNSVSFVENNQVKIKYVQDFKIPLLYITFETINYQVVFKLNFIYGDHPYKRKCQDCCFNSIEIIFDRVVHF